MTMKKVLVVDDSATFRQLLCMGLSRVELVDPASITEATDGEDALKKLQAGHFDLVLTDIRMPRLDGLELVRQVRTTLGNRELPIIIISTKGEERDIEIGMSIGASGYLSKPISISRLRDVVISFLGE
jgi:two-component system, chemotaxis family, chemotaxis protein CheY